MYVIKSMYMYVCNSKHIVYTWQEILVLKHVNYLSWILTGHSQQKMYEIQLTYYQLLHLHNNDTPFEQPNKKLPRKYNVQFYLSSTAVTLKNIKVTKTCINLNR